MGLRSHQEPRATGNGGAAGGQRRRLEGTAKAQLCFPRGIFQGTGALELSVQLGAPVLWEAPPCATGAVGGSSKGILSRRRTHLRSGFTEQPRRRRPRARGPTHGPSFGGCSSPQQSSRPATGVQAASRSQGAGSPSPAWRQGLWLNRQAPLPQITQRAPHVGFRSAVRPLVPFAASNASYLGKTKIK